MPRSRTDAQGCAFAGSQRQVQLYVNRHPDRLNVAIVQAIPELGSAHAIEWRSPLLADRCREYRDAEALTLLGVPELAARLAEFWPLRGPRWDALASIRLPDGGRGAILLEAKSHVSEADSPASAAADRRSVEKIGIALHQAQQWLGVPTTIDWTTTHYQAANRLAHLFFFRHVAGIPTWLVNLYFTDDPSPVRRTTQAEWLRKIEEVKRRMGLEGITVSHQANVMLESLDEPWP
jgi:hypothetical protein